MTDRITRNSFSTVHNLFFLGSAIFLIPISAGVSSLKADQVILKDGRRFNNVRTVPRGNDQFIVFENGKLLRVANEKIEVLEIVPVRWKRGASKGEIQKLIEAAVRKESEKQERIRKEETEKLSRQVETAEKKAVLAEKKAIVAKKEAVAVEKKIKGTVWRSALLPGWGQYHRGNFIRAGLYAGASLIFLENYRQSRNRFDQAQREYNDMLIPAAISYGSGVPGIYFNGFLYFDRRRELLDHETRTNRAFKAIGLIWLWNVIDALYLDYQKRGPESDSFQSFHWFSQINGDGFLLGMEVRF